MASSSDTSTSFDVGNVTIRFRKYNSNIQMALAAYQRNEQPFESVIKSCFHNNDDYISIESIDQYITNRIAVLQNNARLNINDDAAFAIIKSRLEKEITPANARDIARIIFKTVSSMVDYKYIIGKNEKLTNITDDNLFIKINAWQESSWTLFMTLLYNFESYFDFKFSHNKNFKKIETFFDILASAYDDGTILHHPILKANEVAVKALLIYQVFLGYEMQKTNLESWNDRSPEHRPYRLFIWLWPEFRGNIDNQSVRPRQSNNSFFLKKERVREDAKHLHSFPSTICQNTSTKPEIVREMFPQDTENINIFNYDKRLAKLTSLYNKLCLVLGELDSMTRESKYIDVDDHSLLIEKVIEVRKCENALVTQYEKCINQYAELNQTRQNTGRRRYNEKINAHLKLSNVKVFVENHQILSKSTQSKRIINKKGSQPIGADVTEDLFIALLKLSMSILERSRQITSIKYFEYHLKQLPPKSYTKLVNNFRST